jgi:predicted  nucleic acid-binding Zn-ribbon protein
VLKNQISKLENDLKAERGKIWTIKSPTSSFRVSPAASLLKPPSQDATLAMNLQAELDAAKQEIEDLKNTASSAKASRKLTVKFAASTKCDAEEDARRTALMNDLEVARGEAASSKAAAEVAETIIGQLNKQILGLKKEGRDLETANQDMIRCNDALVEAASHHNSPFVIEVARLSSLNFLYLSEGQILQNTLDSTRTELATVTRSCDDKQRSLDAVKYKLSNAQAASSQHEQSIQQLEDRVKSLKTEISCTMEARKEAVEGHEKAQEDHAAVEERIKLLTLDGDDQDIHQMKMLNQSLESNLEESKRALEAEKEESRKAKERQQQLEADLEDEALATDLKLAEKDMVIDDLRSQAGTENTALFDKRVTRLDPAVLKAEQEMARLEGELGTMRDDMSKLQGKLTDATKELERQKRKAEEQRAADKAKVILFNERFEAIQVKLATKTAELDEVKREVEEQKAVISELRDTDSLFED